MTKIGTTKAGYSIIALEPDEASPMRNHRGGEIAVDQKARCMYAWHIFVVLYGVDSIMKACNQYSGE